MPARAELLDQLNNEIKGSSVRQIVTVCCCFKSCKKKAAVLLSLGFANGRWNVYGLCQDHKEDIIMANPDKMSLQIEQAAFYY